MLQMNLYQKVYLTVFLDIQSYMYYTHCVALLL